MQTNARVSSSHMNPAFPAVLSGHGMEFATLTAMYILPQVLTTVSPRARRPLPAEYAPVLRSHTESAAQKAEELNLRTEGEKDGWAKCEKRKLKGGAQKARCGRWQAVVGSRQSAKVHIIKGEAPGSLRYCHVHLRSEAPTMSENDGYALGCARSA